MLFGVKKRLELLEKEHKRLSDKVYELERSLKLDTPQTKYNMQGQYVRVTVGVSDVVVAILRHFGLTLDQLPKQPAKLLLKRRDQNDTK